MSHYKTIQAIRIYLTAEVTENPGLGIFTAGGTSEIRIAEEPINGHTLTWASGLIAKDGIGPRSEGGDLSSGGCPVNYDGLSVELINTNQYLIALAALDIYLPGLTCELYEFSGTETDADADSVDVKFTGIIEDMRGDEATVSIPIKNARYKRNACMAKLINTTDFPNASNDLVGKPVPLSFGKLYPVIDATGLMSIKSMAKFIRTEDEYNDKFLTNDYLSDTTGSTISVYPISAVARLTGSTNIPIAYKIKVDGTGGGQPSATDIYVLVTEGDGSGQIRKVSSFDESVTYGECIFSIANVFEDDLSFATDGTRSWVCFVKINRTYNADFWPCKSFLANTTGSEITVPELYAVKE
jgi:hypothetical protein